MKKMKICYLMIIALLIGSSMPSLALDNWESTLVVKAGRAECRLSFGMHADATDGVDNLFEVPPMDGGDLKAHLILSGKPFWRVVQSPSFQGEWMLEVEASQPETPMSISWSQLPQGVNFTLVDKDRGEIVDMTTTSQFNYNNAGPHAFRIEMSL